MGLRGSPGTSSLISSSAQVILLLVGSREGSEQHCLEGGGCCHFKLGLTGWWEAPMQGRFGDKEEAGKPGEQLL